MEFTTKTSDLLKAIQSLQTRAAQLTQLANFPYLLLRTVGTDNIELSAAEVLPDAEVRVQAAVNKTGAVFLQVEQLNTILSSGKAETADFKVLSDGRVRLKIGLQAFSLQSTSFASFAAPSLTKRRILMRQRKKVGTATSLSIFIHLLFVVILMLAIKDQYLKEEDYISVELIDRLSSAPRVLKKPPEKHHQPQVAHTTSFRPKATPTKLIDATRQALAPPRPNVELARVSNPIRMPASTIGEIPIGPESLLLPSDMEGTGDRLRGPSASSGRFSTPSRADSSSRRISSMIQSTLAVDSADLSDDRFRDLVMVPEDKLGAILIGEGMDVQGHIQLIRLKHSLSDWWQDPTALPSFMKWLSEHTRLRADMKFAGGALPMEDSRILDAPIIFMTGHDRDITVGRNMVKGAPLTTSFSGAERAALRKYIIERGGMLFFDDCGFNGLFAAQVAEELGRIFPEFPMKNIPHSHELYTIYYTLSVPPNGGDVYWGSENNPKASKFRYQKGISIGNRLVVVYNRKDYMCAMETAEIESRTMLRMRRSSDVHRFMTNLLVYAMKYGGNTDRSGYKQ